MTNQIEPTGALTLELEVTPCASVNHADGRGAHLCGATTLATGWGEAKDGGFNPVMLTLMQLDKGAGLMVFLTAEQARTLATSLCMLADKVGRPLT